MFTQVLLSLVPLVAADLYLHNPRGSINRLNEGNNNRNNANRLFDSQDNAAGGYGVAPRLKYYEGSYLTVEWTAQHACGNDNTHCEFILQYMCGAKDAPDKDRIRDGTTTDRIPDDENAHEKTPGDTDYVYGMHESQEYYRECDTRERNKGLFKADRQINGDSARFTRQNNNGNRHGFECTEERDYYPYWHPAPWKDVAIFTTDTSMCSWIRDESQNVRDKGHCWNEDKDKKTEAWKYNNPDDCDKNGHKWVEDGRHDLAAPECLKAPWSRDNHLGNGITDTLAGHMVHYNWTVPKVSDEPCIEEDNCVCVFRIRYNISTGDYEGRPMYPNFADHNMNSDPNDEDSEKVAPVTQDPYVSVVSKPLALALNTNQYGRTFQDRSHTFEIRPRPAWLDFGQRIFNLNVRGKRGNIVQAYPAVEYDFVPTNLIVRHFDYVHFQWTGFDDNPNNGNNNAEGTDGTDRSNIVQIAGLNMNMPIKDDEKSMDEAGVEPLFSEIADRHRMAYLNQDGCLDIDQLLQNNDNNQDEADKDEKNCMKLNAADPYFDGGVIRMNRTGTFYYMSTRNNNFSNRSQKASLTVMPILRSWAVGITVLGSLLCLSSIGVGALLVHAKKNPMSRWASYFEKI